MSESKAWHYTTGEKFALICNDGVLRRAGIGVKHPEKKILWFSSHPYFEPTARKSFTSGGVTSLLDVAELMREGGGLVRFGLHTSKLIRWPQLFKTARMSYNVAQSLEQAGIEQGADPLKWYGTIKDVPIDGVSIEVMNSDLQWEFVQSSD